MAKTFNLNKEPPKLSEETIQFLNEFLTIDPKKRIYWK